MNKKNLDIYLSGKKLYGDDFNIKEIKKWYNDEKEAYYSLNDVDKGKYAFHALNIIHGYNRIRSIKKIKKVLSFGGARGEELLPIIKKIDKIYIIEPSKKLRVQKIGGKKIQYITPKPSGKIAFKENFFDLITCFGTLHHIPNVSFVFKELVRVLKRKSYILIREPIVSMGDWQKPRKGLTKRERGIPLNILRTMIKNNNLEIVSERLVLFPLLRRINFCGYIGSNSKFWVYIDYLLSCFFAWNKRYHSKIFLHKIRPQSVFYVLKKK
ncbi:MAG: methyltransferase domain-containing protein [Candidatus Pacearchaeota archaeon]